MFRLIGRIGSRLGHSSHRRARALGVAVAGYCTWWMGADRRDLPRLLPPASGPNTTSNSSRNAPLSPRPPRSSSSGASRHEPPGAAAGAARHPRHDGSAVGTTAFGTRSPRSRRLPEAKVVPERQAQGAARGSSCKPTQTHRGAAGSVTGGVMPALEATSVAELLRNGEQPRRLWGGGSAPPPCKGVVRPPSPPSQPPRRAPPVS